MRAELLTAAGAAAGLLFIAWTATAQQKDTAPTASFATSKLARKAVDLKFKKWEVAPLGPEAAACATDGPPPRARIGGSARVRGPGSAVRGVGRAEPRQRLAEHPMSSRNLRVAARGANRTLEGILAQATEPRIDAAASGGSMGRHRSG